jgi:hypothetical protein
MLEINSIILDDVFAYSVAQEIIEHDDIKPRSVEECQCRIDWPKWKEAIQAKLDSLTKKKGIWTGYANTPKCKTCCT